MITILNSKKYRKGKTFFCVVVFFQMNFNKSKRENFSNEILGKEIQQKKIVSFEKNLLKNIFKNFLKTTLKIITEILCKYLGL